MNKDNWKYIMREQVTPFERLAGDNSIAYWDKKNDTLAVFISGWVESEITYSYTFGKKNGKWYLTERYETP